MRPEETPVRVVVAVVAPGARQNEAKIRLLGVHASSLESEEGQLNLMGEESTKRWRKALTAVDQIRERFGEDSVSLAMGLKGRFRGEPDCKSARRPGYFFASGKK